MSGGLGHRRWLIRWRERLRRVGSDRAIYVVGEQVYPSDPAGMRRLVGTSTKGDYHVATA
jgi:hypothetical protein